MATFDAQRRRGVHPAAVANTMLAVALVAVAAFFAVRATMAGPPAVAEFAPQAQEIKQAPPEQHPGSLAAGSQGPGAGSLPVSTPTPTVPNDAVLLHCVGDPPRQIEDAQSPPCVPYWSGANGGATSMGVSKQAVEVVWVHQNNNTDSVIPALATALQKFFNSRFELYGRQVHLDFQAETGSQDAQEQGQADGIVLQYRPFASLEWSDEGGLQYSEELARKHVISSVGFQAYPSESQLAAFDPYMWAYEMSSDQMMRLMGRWYCDELAGKPATHAGPGTAGSPRKLAVVYRPWDPAEQIPTAILQQSLSQCGLGGTEVVFDRNGQGTDTPDQIATLLLHFQSEHVTSIDCLCDGLYYNELTESATGQKYFPEWLLQLYSDDTNYAFHFFGGSPDTQQAEDSYGISFQPRQVPIADDPAWWGWKGGDPTASFPAGGYNDVYIVEAFYRSFLEIASGLQMAGPNLTPQSFAAGLHRAIFPNPDTPIHEGDVGFAGSSHSMTVDAAQWWYSPSAPSPNEAQGDQPGSICYVDDGRRWSFDALRPGPDPFGAGPCDSVT